MCKQIDICREVYQEWVWKNPRAFEFLKLKKEIVNQGGILQYDVGYTIGQKMCDAEEKGDLEFIAKEDKYYPKGLWKEVEKK